MASRERLDGKVNISVENVGGIEETSLDLQKGTNILVGRNATNRTSLLQAIMAVMGSDVASVKGDAEEAAVEIELGEDRYHRQLTRDDGTVATTGDPYLEDSTLADLFAFLLESNEARRTVATDSNLRDLIMRPVDLEAINEEIAELEERRRQLDERIEAIEERKGDLPELDSEKSKLEEEISQTRAELAAKEDEIEAADTDVDARREEKQELESKLEELREARSDLEDVRYDIETERESVQSLKEDRSALREEHDALSVPDEGEIDELDARIQQFREQRRRIDGQLNSLQSTIQFNEDVLDGERTDLTEQLNGDSDVADELLPEDEVACWTCGTEVERARIESTVDEFRSLREEKLGEKRDIGASIDELQEEKRSLEEATQRKRELERQRSSTEDEIERRQERLETLKERRSDLETTVREAETEVEDLQSGEFDGILDLHREANELEYELGQLENELESVGADIEEIEEQLAALPELESERESVDEELTDLRTRVEQLERQAIEQFNDHMEKVLDIFNYENLERIWVERVQREVRKGRRKDIEAFFELHVVRSTPGGTTYEDTIDHLSESEREVTGLVFALAGYLAHDVDEEIPFMLLDSLEAIDAARIAELVDYFSDFPEYLVVALLPEDAQALSEEYHRIESI